MNLLNIFSIAVVLILAVTAIDNQPFVHKERFIFHGGELDGCKMTCNPNITDFACSNGKMGNWHDGSFTFRVDHSGYELSSTKATLYGTFNCDQKQAHDIYVSLNGQPLDSQYSFKDPICSCNICHVPLTFSHNITRSIQMDRFSNIFKVHTQSNLCLSHIDAEFVFSPVKSSRVKVKRLFMTGNSSELVPDCPNGISAGTTFNKFFRDGRIDFIDPLSKGSFIVQAAMKVYFKSGIFNANYGKLTAYMNGFKIGNDITYSIISANCMGAYTLEFLSPMYVGGIPMYNYGGKNTLTFKDSVASRVLVGDVEIVLYYVE